MMRRTQSLCAAVCALAAAAALGCANVKSDYPEKHHYMFSAQRTGEARSGSAATLRVRRLRASPAFARRQMVYRTGRLTYESDYYNELFVQPADLVGDETRTWLAQSGLFAHVVDSAARAEARYVLDGTVLRIYGDYTDPGAPRAVLIVQFILSDDSGAAPRILHMKDYTAEVDIGAAEPAALAEGWTDALEALLTELEGDLAALDMPEEP